MRWLFSLRIRQKSVGMMVNKGDKKSDQILAETSALVLANDVIVCVGTSVGMTNQAC